LDQGHTLFMELQLLPFFQFRLLHQLVLDISLQLQLLQLIMDQQESMQDVIAVDVVLEEDSTEDAADQPEDVADLLYAELDY
jgi:hypothetical protein